MSSRRLPGLGLDRFSGLYLWALFIAVFAIWVPRLFLTAGTLHAVAAQQAIAAIVAIAVLVPLAGGAYDLSVGATVNFSTIMVTVLQSNHGWPMWPAIGATVALCALIGAVNGFLVVVCRVNSFIATLGSASVIGAFQAITAGQAQPLPPSSTAWGSLTQHEVLGFQVIVFYMLAIAVVAWWGLARTPAGRYLYAVGGNAEAARLSGVRTGRWTWLALITSATLCGVAGVFYASLSGPSLTFGGALLLPAFAAVFLGSTQLTPGHVNVWGTLIALYALATGIKGLQLVTGVQWLPDMFNGLALLIAVSFAVWRQQGRGRDRPRRVDSVTAGEATTTEHPAVVAPQELPVNQ
ncbi:ABC transporter permease [Frankia sp. AgB1.9]|uniref:ABC transporter permease n=1 Tax=unclassified Frankia TaxID=2632575 RepID=UPI0019325381|nr:MULTISPECIES: ABC transporter permease [unclassified Frankia]MBL7487627.1 ABC transporter permease [Frankia sp. AgW1.1]MBL7550005.1 ABC transporter permease [Frankia sp. AgB1.9]MBL7617863.1 ABC transporter permease [Frankia sp. AgB1.8]